MECGHAVAYGDLITVAKRNTEGLVAEVMQYLEASTPDAQQCAALKGLVKRAIWQRQRDLLSDVGKMFQLEENT